MSKLKELEKRLKDEPENLGLRVTYASALREAGRHDEAVELYRSVAVAYREQGRNQQAIAVCKSILEIAPDDVRCHALLAQLVAHHQGRPHRDTANQIPHGGDEIVIEAGTPTGDPAYRDPAAIPSLTPVPRTTLPGTPAPRPSVPRTITPPSLFTEDPHLSPSPPRANPHLNTPPAGTPRAPVRAPTAPPVVPKGSIPIPSREPSQDAPKRRSSLDETPLPPAMPYHVADPTTRSLKKLSELDLLATPDPDEKRRSSGSVEVDLSETPDPDDYPTPIPSGEGVPVAEGATTRPGSEDGTTPGIKGIAAAARRISASLINRGAEDLSSELDTRQRPRIDNETLEKIAEAPPTVPVERLSDVEVDDEAVTPPPHETLNMRAASNAPDTLQGDDDDDDPDAGVPTISDEDDREPLRPRDTPLDLILRTEAEGPYGTAFFQPLPPEHRDIVLARCHTKSVKKGTVVIRQGEVGHSLVVVLRGQLEARVERPNKPIELGAVGTGEFVGEMSLLARTPSPVHVVASMDCELLMLTPRDFYEVAGAFPALWADLKDVAERRKRDLEAQLKR